MQHIAINTAYNYGTPAQKSWWKRLLAKLGIINCRSSRYYYYEQLSSKYRCLESYTSLTNKGMDSHKLQTSKNISFSTQLPFGAKLKEFGSMSKELCHSFTDPLIPDSEAFLYRTRLGGHRVKLELHFYQKKLFMYNYSFSYLGSDQKRFILELLKQKYELTALPSEGYLVRDPKDCCFIVSETPELNINYFNPKDDFFKALGEAASLRDLQRIKKEERRLQELLSSL